MKYFELLPNQVSGSTEFRNIFRRYYLDFVDDTHVMNYEVQDGETIEKISFKLYQNVDFWWIIALINKFQDIVYDLPLSNEVAQSIAREQATVNGVFNVEKFARAFDKLMSANDAKRIIKVIRPEHMSTIIADIIKKINEQ